MIAPLTALLLSTAALHGPELGSPGRRATIAAASASLLPTLPSEPAAASDGEPAMRKRKQDLNGKHSFFGQVPPPIQGHWSYEQVLAEARAGNVASVQIATQHDCVVATTPIGHRYASYIKDKDFPNLLIDAMGADGSVPFDVLPMNKRNAAIRMAATQLLDLMGLLYVADQLDLLPWDSTPYGSLSEREEGRKAWLARDGKSTKPARVWLDKMLASRRGKPKGVAGSKGGEKEEALRRVLGLSKWDAAAELKALKEKMRPRSLERSLLDARPVEIEREIMEARGKIKTSVAAMQAEVHAELADMALRLQEAPWVTPVTLDTTTSLPTLEELCTRAVPVGSDGVGARMYIRAHASKKRLDARRRAAGRTAKRAAKGAAEAAAGAFVPTDSEDYGHCALSEAFSAHYGGHPVYICTRLVADGAGA